MIGDSARRFQQKVESGEQTVVGVNAYTAQEDKTARQPLARPDPAVMRAHLESFKAFKSARSAQVVNTALDALARAANDPAINIFGKVVEAAEAGCTHGEICGVLRRELGFGHVQAMV
jgi:methylmalonyl-CoA mutase N-terminal domain/subunit